MEYERIEDYYGEKVVQIIIYYYIFFITNGILQTWKRKNSTNHDLIERVLRIGPAADQGEYVAAEQHLDGANAAVVEIAAEDLAEGVAVVDPEAAVGACGEAAVVLVEGHMEKIRSREGGPVKEVRVRVRARDDSRFRKSAVFVFVFVFGGVSENRWGEIVRDVREIEVGMREKVRVRVLGRPRRLG